jgi:tRNA dimethylallyltransferase
LRKKWENEIELRGSAAAHARLLEVDPIAARKIHPTDSRRIIRAMEVWELTGQPISSGRPDWGAAMDVRPIPPNHWIWIAWPRTTLRSRIDQRVHKMIELGWEKEAIGHNLSPPLDTEPFAMGPTLVSEGKRLSNELFEKLASLPSVRKLG